MTTPASPSQTVKKVTPSLSSHNEDSIHSSVTTSNNEKKNTIPSAPPPTSSSSLLKTRTQTSITGNSSNSSSSSSFRSNIGWKARTRVSTSSNNNNSSSSSSSAFSWLSQSLALVMTFVQTWVRALIQMIVHILRQIRIQPRRGRRLVRLLHPQSMFRCLKQFLHRVVWQPLVRSEHLCALDGLSPEVGAQAAREFRRMLLLQTSQSQSSTQSQTQPPTRTTSSLVVAEEELRSSASTSSLFVALGWAAVKQHAVHTRSLLLVVLHSPLHPRSALICQKLAAALSLHNLNINNPANANASASSSTTQAPPSDPHNVHHLTAVGYSIHSAEGMFVARLFSACAFPLVVLVQPPLLPPHPSSSSTSSASQNNHHSTIPLTVLMRAEGPQLRVNTHNHHHHHHHNDLPNTHANNNSIAAAPRRRRDVVVSPQESSVSLDQFVSYVRRWMRLHALRVTEADTQWLQQQVDAGLRHEQDAEYWASLARDQDRERHAQSERDAVQAAEIAATQQLNQARQWLRDNAEAMRLLQQEETNDEDEEPTTTIPRTTTGTSTTTTQIRFVMPSGVKVNGTFAATQTIAVLFAFVRVYVHDQNNPSSSSSSSSSDSAASSSSKRRTNTTMTLEQFALSTSFPRRTFDEDSPLTLQEAQLVPQAVLMVQDLNA